MSEANPTHIHPAASGDGFLIGLKQRAEAEFEKLRAAESSLAGSSAREEKLALWDCVRRNILDGSSARHAFVEDFLEKEFVCFERKDAVEKLEKLIERLSACGAQADGIEQKRNRLEELKQAKQDALDEFRPVKLSLLRSVLASAVCSLETEFEAHVKEASLLQNPQKFMDGVRTEIVSICLQAHAVTDDKHKAFKVDFDKYQEDADMKLLRSVHKLQDEKYRLKFPSSKSTPSNTDKKAVKGSVSAPARPAAASFTLADVTGTVEQKPGNGNSTQTKLNIPVKVTCDKLGKGTFVRMRAADGVLVGGEIVKIQQGEKTKLEEANRDDCAILVLKVLHGSTQFVSKTQPAGMRITLFDDDDHTRWYKVMLMLDDLRTAASPWVDDVMRRTWNEIKEELKGQGEDGSTLETSKLRHFPKIKDDGTYVDSNKHKVEKPTPSEQSWFEAIMDRHTDRGHTKLANSQLQLWAHPQKGYMEVLKLFCDSLGGEQDCQRKQSVSELDPQAVFKIIYNCNSFHVQPDGCHSLNPVKSAAKYAIYARNKPVHGPIKLTRDEYDKICGNLHEFENVLQKFGSVKESCIVHDLHWKEVSVSDRRHTEIMELHQRLKELRYKQLQHDILDQLLPPQLNYCGQRQLLLQTTEDTIFKLKTDWAPDSRNDLKAAITSRAITSGPSVKLLWLQAPRGRGKSSVMAQLIQSSAWAPDLPHAHVVRHFFKRGDLSSSLHVALASMCVQLWTQFFSNDMEIAYDLFHVSMVAAEDDSLDIQELCAALQKQSLKHITDSVLFKLLNKIDNIPGASSSIILQFDALDEVTHRLLNVDSLRSFEVKEKYRNPHDALYSEIFQRLLAKVDTFKRISVIVVVSCTEPLLADSPHICRISVDEFLPHEDVLRIVAHKVETRLEIPACQWTADFADILSALIKSSDLRFLDVRCGLVIDAFDAKQSLRSAPGVCANEPMSYEAKHIVTDLVACTGSMDLVEVVQTYIFQQMLFTCLEADLATWKMRVNLAFDVLVLAAFFGTDSFSISAFQPLVCDERTLDELLRNHNADGEMQQSCKFDSDLALRIVSMDSGFILSECDRVINFPDGPVICFSDVVCDLNSPSQFVYLSFFPLFDSNNTWGIGVVPEQKVNDKNYLWHSFEAVGRYNAGQGCSMQKLRFPQDRPITMCIDTTRAVWMVHIDGQEVCRQHIPIEQFPCRLAITGHAGCSFRLLPDQPLPSSVCTEFQFEKLLTDTLSSIMVSAPRNGQVQFQPEFMDTFRNSASASGGYSNCRRVMELACSRSQLGSHERTSLSASSVLEQRLNPSKNRCFDEMSECFAKATALSERSMRIIRSAHSDVISQFQITHLVGASCPCALLFILQEGIRRDEETTLSVAEVDATKPFFSLSQECCDAEILEKQLSVTHSPERRKHLRLKLFDKFDGIHAKFGCINMTGARLKHALQNNELRHQIDALRSMNSIDFRWSFYSSICERLIHCLGLKESDGLLHYMADKVAETVSGILRSVCSVGNKIFHSIRRPDVIFCFRVLLFLQSLDSSFDLPGLLMRMLQPRHSNLHVALFKPLENPMMQLDEAGSDGWNLDGNDRNFPPWSTFFCSVLQCDPSLRRTVEQLMLDCGLNMTDVWNSRLMSTRNGTRNGHLQGRLFLSEWRSQRGVHENSLTQNIIKRHILDCLCDHEDFAARIFRHHDHHGHHDDDHHDDHGHDHEFFHLYSNEKVTQSLERLEAEFNDDSKTHFQDLNFDDSYTIQLQEVKNSWSEYQFRLKNECQRFCGFEHELRQKPDNKSCFSYESWRKPGKDFSTFFNESWRKLDHKLSKWKGVSLKMRLQATVRVHLIFTDVCVFTCAFHDHECGTFRCRSGPVKWATLPTTSFPSCQIVKMLADWSKQTPTTPSFQTRCLARTGSHENEPSDDVDRRVLIVDGSWAHAADIEDCLRLFMNQDDIDDNIQLVMSTVSISRAHAIKALLEHGNVVDTILALSESE